MSGIAVDAFGNLRVGGETLKARVAVLSTTAAQVFVIPADDPGSPRRYELAGPPTRSGRTLRGVLADGGGEFFFQKAGCGCQTPLNLRGPLSRLLPAEAPA